MMSMENVSRAGVRLAQCAVLGLNQPVVKGLVKRVMGVASGLYGILAVLDMKDRFNQGYFSGEETPVKIKRAYLAVRVSMIGLALTTLPGSYCAGWFATSLFGEQRLMQLFGPNIHFAGNPLHPRHVVSIGSALIGSIALVTLLYERYRPLAEGENRTDLANPWVMVPLFLFSRPSLHCGNALMARIR